MEYTLTPLGQEAASKVEAMVDWIEQKLPEIMQFRRDNADTANQ
ncbi:HxlR family transcriptional regulator [Pseudomonas sp. G5(2012)]|nr:HxlR family transcriptional regulator [Pseudomonas sp. G5(2012)]